MKIRILQHEEWLDGAEYVSWAKRNNHVLLYTKVFNNESLPQDVDADALIVLGGPQNPKTTQEEYSYFNAKKEKEYILKYINSDKVVIGSCLGAQLIGEALGADYHHSPNPEVGYVLGRLTKEGRKDKFFSDFPEELNVGEWHNDMPGLTKDAVIIMESDGCPRQIVRFKKFVYGFQAHIEFHHDSFINGLGCVSDNVKRCGPYIKNEEDILSFDTTNMNKVLSSFLDKLFEEYTK